MSPSPTAALSTHALSIGYRLSTHPPAILGQDLNLELHRGELTCLIGRNGMGKSTLIRTLAALHPPLAGELHWQGRAPESLTARARARELSVVLTSVEHTGSMRVEEVVALGRYPYTAWHGNLSENDHRIIESAMERTGCLRYRNRSLQMLSDGERQRALIARALAQQTAILILDEPTAFLDLPGRAQTMLMLREMARVHDLAILLSTHDLALALDAADRLWLMEDSSAFHEGAPEDLVLSGTMERVFARDGIVLDAERGALRLDTPKERVVKIEAAPSARRIWLEHALERSGYRTDDVADLKIIQDEVGWQLIHADHSEHLKSLGALTRALRKSHLQYPYHGRKDLHPKRR